VTPSLIEKGRGCTYTTGVRSALSLQVSGACGAEQCIGVVMSQ
jgi:hypothetical protein